MADLLVYLANLRPVALPAALLPFSILLDKSVRLDRFADYLREGQPGTPNYLRHRHSALRRTENWEKSRVSEAVLLGLAPQSDPAHDPRRIRSHAIHGSAQGSVSRKDRRSS